MKKSKILIFVGTITLAVIIFLIVMVYKCGGEGVMSLREAERQVRELKEKITLPIDEATREKINSLTNDLEHNEEYTVEINSQKYTLATKANWDLRKIGEAAIPQLIDAAATHKSTSARQYALAIIYDLNVRDDNDLLQYLPVFARSMYDRDPEVRGTAMSQIGNMAIAFRRHKRQKELEQLIPYLVKGLRDREERMQLAAGEYLFQIGRKDLVPEELAKKHRLAERNF